MKHRRVIDDPFTFWWGLGWLVFGFTAGTLMGAWLW